MPKRIFLAEIVHTIKEFYCLCGIKTLEFGVLIPIKIKL